MRVETSIEKSFCNRIKSLGGMCLKWVCPGLRGVPDRIVLLPIPEEHRGIVSKYLYFTELKTLEGDLSIHQKIRREELENLGFKVEVRDENLRS